MYEWNKPLAIVLEIKNEYIKQFGLDTIKFEDWLKRLNNEKYNNIFDCLQLNQENEYLLIRYGIAEMQESMWIDADSIYRECRSLVINLEKEELVLTPFKKFFNLNEVDENKLDSVINEIISAKTVEFTNKLDGSMQSCRYYNNTYFMAGSKSLNINTSWRLEDGYKMLTDNYKKMLSENQEYTFIFEYISLKDAHVVLYDKCQEGLYLIGVRNVYTGEELNYSDIVYFSKKYSVPMAEIENVSIDEILEKSKTLKSNEKEGWVLNIDGHRIKIKCDDYIQLHKLLNAVSSTNVIIQHIAENRYDDMISKIPDNYKNRIIKIADLILKYKFDMEEKICYNYSIAPKSTTKEFMIWADKNCEKDINGYVKCMYNNRKFNVLKKNHNGYKKIHELSIFKEYSAMYSNVEEE